MVSGWWGKGAPSTIKSVYPKNIDTFTSDGERHKALKGFTGFGGFSSFLSKDENLPKVDELKSLVTAEEYDSLFQGVLDAFYTPDSIGHWIYDLMAEAGLKSDHKILDSAFGLGAMTKPFIGKACVEAIEKDSITAQISAELYSAFPDFKINHYGLENHTITDSFYDAVIINPPYGESTVYDPLNSALSAQPIHNYFLLKSAELLVENGLLVALVTSSFMDSNGAKSYEARSTFDRDMALLTGYRLPTDTFKKSGTCVSTDLLIFRKRTEIEKKKIRAQNVELESPITKLGAFQNAYVNKYFQDNSNNILGTPSVDKNQYGKLVTVCKGSLENALAILNERKINLDFNPANANPDELFHWGALGYERDNQPNPFEYTYNETIDSYVMRITHNNYRIFDNTKITSLRKDSKKETKLFSALELSEQLNKVKALESESGTNSVTLEDERTYLSNLYEAFVAKHKAINNSYNSFLLEDDRLLNLAGLELNYSPAISEATAEKQNTSPKLETWERSEILTKRVYSPIKAPSFAQTPAEALTLSILHCSDVNFDYMTSHSSFSKDELINALEGDLIFFDPETFTFSLRDRYLSGNIRQKLLLAEKYNGEHDLSKNIALLREAAPAEVKPHQLDVPFIASWVPTAIVEAFIADVTGSHLNEVEFALGTFFTKVDHFSHDAQTQFGTTDLSVAQILEKTMNKRQIRVTYKDGDGKTFTDTRATLAAQAKSDAIKRYWKTFLGKNSQYLDELTAIFNSQINCFSTKDYDGSHLTIEDGRLYGQSENFKFRKHQIDALWAKICMNGGLAAHCVGAGKSALMAAAAYIGVENGTLSNPIITTKNNVCRNLHAEFLRIFPNANVLLIDGENAKRDSATRRRLLSRIAHNRFHAIIMSHETFTSIEAPQDGTFLAVNELKGEIYSPKRQKSTSRAIAKRIHSINNKIEKAAKKASRNRGYGFDLLNCNMLMVDEADEFKNLLAYSGYDGVKGLGNLEGSGMAFDLLCKVRHINLKHNKGSKGIYFATGTPLSNSITETYTLARYLKQDALDSMGFNCLDAFLSAYATPNTEPEINGVSKFKPQTRFRDFTNLIALNSFFKSFTHSIDNAHLVRTYEEQGRVWPAPTMTYGKPIDVVVKPCSNFTDYNQHLVFRAENINQLDDSFNGAYKNDNMLAIISANEGASMDLRLAKDLHHAEVELDEDYRSPKITELAKNIVNVYQNIKADECGTQLVFIDRGTPRQHSQTETLDLREFSVYHSLKDTLVSSGIPAKEIAFIHDAPSIKRREELFAKVRTGEIRVFVCSTDTAGAGTNIQDRIVALHSVNQHWRPRDSEQQFGRALRQGNIFFNESVAAYERGEIGKDELFTVNVYRYAMQLSLDAMKLSANEAKARFIRSFLSNDAFTTNRITLREDNEDGVDFSELKAQVCGRPEVLLQYKNNQTLRILQALEDDHEKKASSIRYKLSDLPKSIKRNEGRIKDLQEQITLSHAILDAYNKLNTAQSGHTKAKTKADSFKTLEGLVNHIFNNILNP